MLYEGTRKSLKFLLSVYWPFTSAFISKPLRNEKSLSAYFIITGYLTIPSFHSLCSPKKISQAND